MDKLISIIIPVYNSEKYLADCLETVIAQTYAELEIIIVDDGSKDKSLDIANKYALRDSRIKVIHKENGGVSSARNRGLAEAKGEFITFVDSDDKLAPDMCEKLISAFDDDVDMVIAGVRHDFAKESKEYKVSSRLELSPDRADELFDKLLDLYFINTPCAKLYRRLDKGLPLFDEKFALGEDFLYNLAYMDSMKNKIIAIPDVVYFYNRCNEASATAHFRRADIDNEICLNRAINAFRKRHGSKPAKGDIIDRRLYVNGMNHLLRVFGSDISSAEKREILRETLSKQDYYEVCTVRYRKSIKEDIYRFLCKKKCIFMIELYYKVYCLLRRSMGRG
ncbi:MAG: glycosyltransferase family 2 protein [Eubacteriales bacterium]|nr:glycosyltransferase family 2 protein [Eubacteriales bacterium]